MTCMNNIKAAIRHDHCFAFLFGFFYELNEAPLIQNASGLIAILLDGLMEFSLRQSGRSCFAHHHTGSRIG